jgi:hypothetical protein
VLRKHSMTTAEYHFRLKNQGGGCAICGEQPRGLEFFPVDHDHETLRIRGILCQGCNKGLGHFKDDPVRLRSALAYLEKSA